MDDLYVMYIWSGKEKKGGGRVFKLIIGYLVVGF